MAILKSKEKEFEVQEGEKIKEFCKDLGVSFCCEDGMCGSCLIEVKSGENNLSDLSEAEKDLGLEDKKSRLACQCIINKGEVEFEPY